MISKICRGYSTSEDFEDLRQEVFYQLWKSIASFEGNAKISTWLYRLTLNVCLTNSRKNSKTKNIVPISSTNLNTHIQEDSKADPYIKYLYDSIRELKPIDRSVIMLYLDKLTHEEIASILGIGKANVGVKINRIKKKKIENFN